MERGFISEPCDFHCNVWMFFHVIELNGTARGGRREPYAPRFRECCRRDSSEQSASKRSVSREWSGVLSSAGGAEIMLFADEIQSYKGAGGGEEQPSSLAFESAAKGGGAKIR